MAMGGQLVAGICYHVEDNHSTPGRAELLGGFVQLCAYIGYSPQGGK
jgi:hypothetical protein